MPTDHQFENEPGSPDEPATVVVPGPLVADPASPSAPVVSDPMAVTEERVVEEQLVGPADGESVVGSRTVAESQSAVVETDGTVATTYRRVEDETVVARRPSWFWPFLALLALAVILGLLAWWYFSEQDSKQVPSVVGSSLSTAVNRLQQADFKSSIIRSTHPERAGIVFAQNPSASTEAEKGSVVRLAVSNGPGLIAVPSAVGQSDAAARQSLVGAGLQVTEARVFSSQAPGTVIAQDPPAGEKVASGQSVRINVSKGTGTAVVPNAVGLGEAAARSGIVAAGFRVTEARVPSTQSSGTVIAQYPVAGSRAGDGTIVRINVAETASRGSAATTSGAATAGSASGPTSTSAATASPTSTQPVSPTPPQPASPAPAQTASAPVPSLSGPVLGAAQRLAAAGFRVSVAYVPSTSALGTVVAQEPAAGTSAPTGSHVTVNVSAGAGQSTLARVPDVVGKTIPEGVSAFHQAGLRLLFLRYPVNSKTQAGKIIEQSPAAGANAPKNAQILVYMGAYQK